MKRYLQLFVWALLVCVATPGFAEDTHAVLVGESHAALIKDVHGEVKITRQQHTFDATSGTKLLVSDRVVASSGATAAIVFRDGTLLTLGSGADILVRNYVFEPKSDKFAFALYLAKGSAIYESGKIGKLSPQSVQVQTPNATVGVRGTRFLIEAN